MNAAQRWAWREAVERAKDGRPSILLPADVVLAVAELTREPPFQRAREEDFELWRQRCEAAKPKRRRVATAAK